MYEVSIQADFSAAHHLSIGGKCESLHGHNFRVEVVVEAERLDGQGLVIDFRRLREKTRAALEAIDHKYLNELPPFQGLNPSAECLAAYLFGELSRELDRGDCRVGRVSVWESDSSRATFLRPEK